MSNFLGSNPNVEDYWRSIILYGQNAACYKFALGKALLEIAPTGKIFITLEELAEPYSRHIAEHLMGVDKQTTSRSSRFLNTCREFNSGEVDLEDLIDVTVKLGFENVIDAFHNVNKSEISVRFFTDERQGKSKGIALTDNLLKLPELYQGQNLPQEVEARWRLVERAWQLNISRNLIKVNYDHESEIIYTGDHRRRVNVTSCRDALNGYQKGKCFYCFGNISIKRKSNDLADVDHFFSRRLIFANIAHPIDGPWNLVLACPSCNRGVGGKFDQLPIKRFLERLHKRNEFFISSHHPLRDTLIGQTGKTVRQTECDGMVRICHTVLAQHGIEHQPMIGILSRKQREIDSHFCINLPSGERIDYRAKLWLGNSEEVPHGVFQPSDFPTAIYEGEPVELELLSSVLFKILTSAV